MSTEKCSICGKMTKYYCKNIYRLRTSCSETPINLILERILQSIDVLSVSESNETLSCQQCILKIEEYDAMYTKAKSLEQDLINILIRSSDESDSYPLDHSKFVFRKRQHDDGSDLNKGKNLIEDSPKSDEYFKTYEFEDEIDLSYVESQKDEDDFQEIWGDSSEITESNDDEANKEEIAVCANPSQWNECSICEKVFNSKRKLDIHKKDHQFRYKCEFCEKSFKTEILLDIHLQTHKGLSELECNHCSKKFTSKGGLVKHMKLHTGDFNYQCEQCGKQFLHDSSIRMHKLSHMNVREKICSVCKRAFRSAQHLTRHLRTHTGEKPYYCDKCGKTFAQKYNMVTHYTKVHRISVPRRKFYCDYCSESFSIRNGLIEHMRITHDDQEYASPILSEDIKTEDKDDEYYDEVASIVNE